MTSLTAFVVVVLLVALERLAELVVSKRNAAWSLSQGGVETGPHFELHEQPHEAVVTVDDKEAVLTSGELSVRFARDGEWRMEFRDADGRTITSSDATRRAIPPARAPEYRPRMSCASCVLSWMLLPPTE